MGLATLRPTSLGLWATLWGGGRGEAVSSIHEGAELLPGAPEEPSERYLNMQLIFPAACIPTGEPRNLNFMFILVNTLAFVDHVWVLLHVFSNHLKI